MRRIREPRALMRQMLNRVSCTAVAAGGGVGRTVLGLKRVRPIHRVITANSKCLTDAAETETIHSCLCASEAEAMKNETTLAVRKRQKTHVSLKHILA